MAWVGNKKNILRDHRFSHPIEIIKQEYKIRQNSLQFMNSAIQQQDFCLGIAILMFLNSEKKTQKKNKNQMTDLWLLCNDQACIDISFDTKHQSYSNDTRVNVTV